MPIYTAFISSTSDLVEERRHLNDKLIDFNIFPFAMEHFTVPTIDGFSDIKKMISNSDFFFMILGLRYGSRDQEGKSWTQKEYEYASCHKDQNGTKIWVAFTSELNEVLGEYDPAMSDEELMQICPSDDLQDLRDQLDFARSLASGSSMVATFHSPEELGIHCISLATRSVLDGDVKGWERGLAQSALGQIVFGKTYYHVHLSEAVEDYLRIGTVKFKKDRNPGGVLAEAKNYQVQYDQAKDIFIPEERNFTKWTGQYLITDGSSMKGVYTAFKNKRVKFGQYEILPGSRDGIHTLTLANRDDLQIPYILEGTFQDAVDVYNPALKCKSGNILIFESAEERLAYLKKNYADRLAFNQVKS